MRNLLERGPTDELSQCRAPTKDLYLCGASQNPHGCITFAHGCNSLSVIADDFNLDKWWVQI